MDSKYIIIIVIVVVLLCLLFRYYNCGMTCCSKDKFSHRVSTPFSLIDNAYQKEQLRPYSGLKWRFDVLKKVVQKDLRKGMKYLDSSLTNCDHICDQILPKGGNKRQCMDNCVAGRVMNKISNKQDSTDIMCTKDSHCPFPDICVTRGAYTEGPGYCMSQTEPFRFVNKNPQTQFQETGCPPSYFWNDITKRCEPRFQEFSSAAYIRSQRPGPEPHVTLPGATMPGYGTGENDPYDVPINFRLTTDQ